MTTPRDQLYFDIFITALEGGIGYWSQALSYHHERKDGRPGDPGDNILGFYADIVETGDGDDDVPHRIDRSVIARGYGLAVGEWRNRINWSSGEKPPIIIDEDTDWDFDAADADTIVQLGLGLIDTIRDTGQQCVRYG